MKGKKIVRMLLRVSSNQQLEADGDLSVQRQLVTEFVEKHEDWILDEKEYFEGSNSGYKNTVDQRETLQKALCDAKNGKFQILVAYKDDRVGRRMWEMGAYIMTLKSFGVDTYTVKDGCISPEIDDIMGQMMLALRYGSAQKSSSDTGMRVKDTAQKLVQKGKFMGGSAPYGYELVLSGEVSKHGRALHVLKIIPERAEVVKQIYYLSLYKEYGSSKIASVLNADEHYKKMAPKDVWKAGTITSILTNPVYAGHVAYKRRERKNGKYHRLGSEEWITSSEANESIRIIDDKIWHRTQEKRRIRSDKYKNKLENREVKVINKSYGCLPLIDVIYCGYCGRKLTNGSKYSYWTIKETGERRTSKVPIYRCQNAQQGVPHNHVKQFRADEVEKIVFDYIAEYIGRLLKKEDLFTEITKNQQKEKHVMESEVKKEKQDLQKIQKEIEMMEANIPNAMAGNYVLTLEELVNAIRKHKGKEKEQKEIVQKKEFEIKNIDVRSSESVKIKEKLPSWQQIFKDADADTKRVLVNKLIERIDITQGQIVVRFRIEMEEFLHRIPSDSPTILYKHGSK